MSQVRLHFDADLMQRGCLPVCGPAVLTQPRHWKRWVACRHAAQPRVGMEDVMRILMLTRRFAS